MERKTEAPRRYFTAQERYGEALPEDRLIALELLEVDAEAGVARFSVEMTVSAEDGEVWFATLPGWEGRIDPAELADAAIGKPVMDELAIPLSEDPQLTQLEVRNFATGAIAIYWIKTQGRDDRAFRYRSFPDGAVGEGAIHGYLVQRPDDWLETTTDSGSATHAHAVDPDGGDLIVVTIGDAAAMERPREVFVGDTLAIYGV